MKVNLFNIQHFSLQDGPAIRTVVFFKGCPLNCIWCHNPESKSKNPQLLYDPNKCRCCGKCESVCPQGAHSMIDGRHWVDFSLCIACGRCTNLCVYSALEVVGREYTVDEIMEELAKDDAFFFDGGGVTFSGGEPFLQFDALYELLIRCKEKAYSTCIETSGFTSADHIKKAAKYTDWFLYDCKMTDSVRHQRYVGQDNQKIIENLFVLDHIKAKVVLRCPIIPTLNDDEAHFFELATIANAHSSVQRIELMPYHPLGIFKSQLLGDQSGYQNKDFLSEKLATQYASIIAQQTKKPIIVSGMNGK